MLHGITIIPRVAKLPLAIAAPISRGVVHRVGERFDLFHRPIGFSGNRLLGGGTDDQMRLDVRHCAQRSQRADAVDRAARAGYCDDDAFGHANTSQFLSRASAASGASGYTATGCPTIRNRSKSLIESAYA